MIKIVITGGDNCYCCECGGVCDREVMEEDTTAKTLRYIDTRGLCLGKHCSSWHACEDGTELRRDYAGKWHAYRNGEELPCAVRNNKWGKDCEFSTRGTTFYATDDDRDERGVWLRDDQKERTGWRLVK